MKRPDPLISSKPGAEDIEVQSNRVIFLNAAYIADGREDPLHPFHGTYTNLNTHWRHVDEIHCETGPMPDQEPEPVCPMPVREPVCPMPKAA